MWLANRKSNVPDAKYRKHTSSAGMDVAVGGYMSATPDDNDIPVCEVEWDSPRPLSGNACYYVLFI